MTSCRADRARSSSSSVTMSRASARTARSRSAGRSRCCYAAGERGGGPSVAACPEAAAASWCELPRTRCAGRDTTSRSARVLFCLRSISKFHTSAPPRITVPTCCRLHASAIAPSHCAARGVPSIRTSASAAGLVSNTRPTVRRRTPGAGRRHGSDERSVFWHRSVSARRRRSRAFVRSWHQAAQFVALRNVRAG